MSYIGATPAESYASFYVQHFTTSATTSYALDYPVVNENDLRLVINNVVQQPGSGYAYTAAASTLTLSAATTTSDTMYAVFLGRALQTVNPPADSVGGTQLADTAISGQTALGAEPADTDEFLVSDAGTLKRMDYSYIKASGPGLTFLARETASGVSAASFDGYFTSDYTNYIVYWSDWSPAVDANLYFVIRQSDSDVTSSDYQSSGQGNQRASGANTSMPSGGFGEAFARISYQDTDGASNFTCAGNIVIYNPLGTTDYKNFTVNSLSHGTTGSNYLYCWIGTNYFDGNTTAMSGITFKPSTGNMDGVFDLYGIKNS